MVHRRKPGRGVDGKGRSKGAGRHLQMMHFLLESAAWKGLAPVERALFVEVAQRYDGYNNGRIGMGVRTAAAAIHAAPNTVSAAFATLVERGLLALTKDSSFSQKQLVREWRVTCFSVGPWDAPTARATHDYQRWHAPEKQRPVANGVTASRNPCTPVSNEATVSPSIVSDDATIGPAASLNPRHPSRYHGRGDAGEPREAEPSDAQRSAADTQAIVKRLACLKRMPD
jgi:hypothetical protein